MEQSSELGARLSKIIEPPLLVELVGDLGSGKTALVKAIAKGLGIEQTVTSPTFNIHRQYIAPSGVHLEHFDFYRLADDEVIVNELKDSLLNKDTIVCTEWANQLNSKIDDDRLVVECFFINENERKYIFKSTGARSNKAIEELQK